MTEFLTQAVPEIIRDLPSNPLVANSSLRAVPREEIPEITQSYGILIAPSQSLLSPQEQTNYWHALMSMCRSYRPGSARGTEFEISRRTGNGVRVLCDENDPNASLRFGRIYISDFAGALERYTTVMPVTRQALLYLFPSQDLFDLALKMEDQVDMEVLQQGPNNALKQFVNGYSLQSPYYSAWRKGEDLSPLLQPLIDPIRR